MRELDEKQSNLKKYQEHTYKYILKAGVSLESDGNIVVHTIEERVQAEIEFGFTMYLHCIVQLLYSNSWRSFIFQKKDTDTIQNKQEIYTCEIKDNDCKYTETC